MIVSLGSKKGGRGGDKSFPELTHLQTSLLMIIVDTPERDLSNVDGKFDIRKVCTSSVKSSSTLF